MRIEAAGIPALVQAVEYLGADSLVEARVGRHTLVIRMPGRSAVIAGAPIRIVWDSAATHWFDSASGRRIDVA